MSRSRSLTLGAALLLLPWLAGCVTVAEFRKLEHEVYKMKRSGGGSNGGTQVADLAAELDVPVPMGSKTQALITGYRDNGFASDDVLATVRALEEQADFQVRGLGADAT